MSIENLIVDIHKDGICHVTLNRPEKHNAFDDEMIRHLTTTIKQLEKNTTVRVIVLCATGKSFSAGADLNWMQRMVNYTEQQNHQDALEFAELMLALYFCTKPTIACVQGAAYGGGIGLIACCDIAIASDNTNFCLSEVKLGLIPAVISPFVIQAIGPRIAQRYFLTAELFNATQAQQFGLIHEVVTGEELNEKVQTLATTLIKNGPHAIKASKQLIRDVTNKNIDSQLMTEVSHRIAKLRVSQEGQEGIQAFLQKRKPKWA